MPAFAVCGLTSRGRNIVAGAKSPGRDSFEYVLFHTAPVSLAAHRFDQVDRVFNQLLESIKSHREATAVRPHPCMQHHSNTNVVGQCGCEHAGPLLYGVLNVAANVHGNKACTVAIGCAHMRTDTSDKDVAMVMVLHLGNGLGLLSGSRPACRQTGCMRVTM